MSQAINYIIIGLIALGFLLGFRDGLIKKVFSFTGFVLAILASFSFSPRIRPYLISYLHFDPTTAVIFSFIFVFLIILILSKILIKIIRPKKSVLGFIDRFLGAALGGFQMALFVSGLLIFLSLFHLPSAQDRANLKYYNFTYNLLPETFGFVRKVIPESEIVFDIFEKLKEKVLKGNGSDI
jgi:uncharacterized membrane protein required for colicin V production